VIATPIRPQELDQKQSDTDYRKHYWLSPPELKEQVRAEIGDGWNDPCPFPRPDAFDGLNCEWGPTNFVNPPFGSITDPTGKKIGVTAWVRKMIAEHKKGRTSVLVYPMDGWVHLLLAEGAEMRSIGDVRWLATEDGSPRQTGGSRPIMLFTLRGLAPKEETGGSDAPPMPDDSTVSAEPRKAESKPNETDQEEL
jgi:hypothetical protein